MRSWRYADVPSVRAEVASTCTTDMQGTGRLGSVILRDHQHKAVMAAVAQERQAADQRERELRDARARLDRVPIDTACSTPAVIDEAMDIIGGGR